MQSVPKDEFLAEENTLENIALMMCFTTVGDP